MEYVKIGSFSGLVCSAQVMRQPDALRGVFPYKGVMAPSYKNRAAPLVPENVLKNTQKE